jgi:hypothetical protein
VKIRQRLTRPRLPGRGRRRLRAAAAACVTVVLGLGYAQGTAAAQPAGRPDQPTRRDVPNVPVAAVPATKAAPPTLASATDAPAPVWPSAGAAETMLPTDSGQAAVTKPQHVGTLPVLVNRTSASKSAGRVRVQVYDRGSTAKAGVKGVLLRVAPGDAASPNEVSVTVNYNAFRTAYGGGWASRLRLSLLPECALLTPDKPTCAPRALPSSQNNAKSRQVTATVPLTALNTFGALLALDADPSGPAGDYTATALKPSSTWSAGGNSGAFTWSYPMRVPPVPGDVAPVVELGYNSQAIDGRHAAANNQPSWAKQHPEDR